jgi:hypothetical protein
MKEGKNGLREGKERIEVATKETVEYLTLLTFIRWCSVRTPTVMNFLVVLLNA